MAVYKDKKSGTWYVKVCYTDYTGTHLRKTKRGFTTKREATAWENAFLLTVSGSTNMVMKDFVKVYCTDKSGRVKESTEQTRDNIIYSKILPKFGDRAVAEITATDVLKWQNDMLKELNPATGKHYSPSYLKTVHSQFSAIMNHAVRFYGLKTNPVRVAGNMGTDEECQFDFWTRDEYELFSKEVMDVPVYYYAFEILYWCGLREGELLALTLEDIDLKKGIIDVNKTYYHLKGHDVITDPKTKKSKRKVAMPEFLIDELREYISLQYKLNPTERLFPITKSGLSRMLKRYAKEAGVKSIRVHDLRHSHVSLLIDMGYSAVAIGKRVGHASEHITYKYAHMFPSAQQNMIKDLNKAKEESDVC